MIPVMTTPARDPAQAAEHLELAGHDELPAKAADVRTLEGGRGGTPWPVSGGLTLPVRRWAQRLLDAHH